MLRFISSRPQLLLALALLLAPAAWAQPSDLVALHPCVIVGVKSKAQVEDFQTLCATEVARSDAQLVPSTQVRDFLAAEVKGGSCLRIRGSKFPWGTKSLKSSYECLGKLATATQAARAVLIAVQPGSLTRVNAVVVNANGELVDQKSIQLRSRGKPVADTVRTAITRLREQLSIAPVKLAPLVAQPEPPPPPPPPAAATPPPEQQTGPVPPEAHAEAPGPDLTPKVLPSPPSEPTRPLPRTERTWKTPVAYASAGAGAVAAGLAVFFGIQSNGTADRFNTLYANAERPEGSELPLPKEELINELQELRQQVGTQRTLAGVSAGVGAALIGAGAALWFIDRPEAPAGKQGPGSASLSIGPGGVGLRVLLP
ncbi:MAG TPA: hypothetical protein VLQ93_20900 [Myxococcaceae bacterium]|nr:hypothetical protein [Myxococcaceae bacterium]